MFTTRLKQAGELNRIDLNSIKGKRMYYNKTRNTISLVFKLLLTVGIILSCIFFSKRGKNEADLAYVFLMVITCLLLIDSIFESIGTLLLKNPVFILQGEQIYYIKTNKWYPILEYDFRDEYIGKNNFYATFCVFNRKGERIIAEKNWRLKEEEAFKSHIKYNKLLLSEINR